MTGLQGSMELLQMMMDDKEINLSGVDDSVLDALLQQLASANEAVKIIDRDRKRLRQVCLDIYTARGIKEFNSAAGTAKLVERKKAKWNYDKLREMIGEVKWSDITIKVDEVDEEKRNAAIKQGLITQSQVDAATTIQGGYWFTFKEKE